MGFDAHRLPQPVPLFMQPIQPLTPDMDLKSAAFMLRRRARLILWCIGGGLAAGLALALVLTPVYKADTMVMIEPRHTDMNVGQMLSPLAVTSELVRSEMEVVQSRATIDRVIDDLQLDKDREFNPPPHFWNWLDPANWSGSMSEAEKQARRRAKIAERVDKKLSVENDGRSFVMDIVFEAKNPRKAARIANAIADIYLQEQMEAKYQTVARANAWLSGRLAELKIKVMESEKAVEDYRERNRLIALDDGETVAVKQMEDIDTQLSDARGEVSQAEARLQAAQDLLHKPGGLDSASDVLSSPLIQNLREQEADLRRGQADLAAKYGPLHPKLLNARAQYRDLQAKIAEEAQRVVQGLANQLDSARGKEQQIESQLAALESRAGVEMKANVTLRQLEREADANRSLYDNFLNSFKQTSEQSDAHASDARVIAAAEPPPVPSFPGKLLFMAIGAVLGGILGVIAAYLVEYFDKGFRNGNQVEQISGMPVIGVVPDIRDHTDRRPEDYVAERPMSSYGEALRTVRAAVHFSNPEHPPKIVTVTSSVPGEGKTTFCVSMARTLARTGNRVLLIDADMRRSRSAAAYGAGKISGGLAAVLSGQSSFAENVVPDPAVKGLDIVFAAGKSANAQDLLASQAMRALTQDAAAKYDLVIIDTPPILAVADAAAAARVSDATIFLVRWATTPRDQALDALKQLASLKCQIAGIVLSQVDMVEQAKYSESYYHRNYVEYDAA